MQNETAFIRGTSVVFPNGNQIDFKVEILKIIQASETVIVVPIKSLLSDENNNNVFSFSVKGDFLWRLKTEGTEFDVYTKPTECKFVDAFLRPNGDLILFNWCGFAFRINLENGLIIERFESR